VSDGFDWFPDWSRDTAIIVASGPSAAAVPLESAKGRARWIVVNEGHRLAPWADAIYAADHPWWVRNRGLRNFSGLRMSQSDAARKSYGVKQINLRRVDTIVTQPRGTIGYGGNSGFQAINLAVQFGAKRIVLVGFDLRIDLGVHWHGRHEQMNNPAEDSVARWARILDGVARQFRALNIQVLNASPVSVLNNYPKVDFAEAMGMEIAA
jgi:hypothetical protein